MVFRIPPHLQEAKESEKLDEKSDEKSDSPQSKEELRKSSRTKQKEQKEKEPQGPQEWPATEAIEWDKLTQDDRDRFNEGHNKKEVEIQELVLKLQQGNAIYPIGRDRTFRRYWIFRTLPGLFVEDEELFIPDDYLQVVPQVAMKTEGDEKSTSSDKENESFENNGGSSSNLAAGDKKDSAKAPSVELESVQEQITNYGKVSWGYYSSAEEIDALIEGLNPRGHREGPLKQALQEQRDRIVAGLGEVPVDLLSVQADEATAEAEVYQAISLKKRKGHIKGDQAEEFLELNLREMLLDIEERVFVGGLGQLKVSFRSNSFQGQML